MKQIVLKIAVLQNGVNVHEVSNAQPSNIQSCIDLWHSPGTEIVLSFDEIEVSAPQSNS